jgi:molybdate transport system ATP-binding protein
VALSLTEPEAISVRNVVAAEVAAVELETGAFAEVLLKAAGQNLRARITRKSAVELGLVPGRRVFALVKSIAVETSRQQPRGV